MLQILKQLSHPPRAQEEVKNTEAWYFCEGGLLANHHDYSLTGRLLIKLALKTDCCQCMAKPIQYCKVISLQLTNKFILKK